MPNCIGGILILLSGITPILMCGLPGFGDESSVCTKELNNPCDTNAIAVQHDNMLHLRTVGHVPWNYAPICSRLLTFPNHRIRCRVTGSRLNRGAGYGLEVPVDYIFADDEKVNRIRTAKEDLDEKCAKCMK